jgi:hypothetical protein
MSDIALRPRSATELVDAAFQLYRRDPLPLITGLAIIYVPWLLFVAIAGFTSLLTAQADPTAFEVRSYVLAVGSELVAYLLAATLMTVLASDLYLGRPIDLVASIRAILPRLGAVLVAALIVAVCGLFGFLFLVVPGVYVVLRLFAVKQAVLLEGKSGVAAVGRSWNLVKGHAWHVFVTMLLALLLNLALTFGAGMVAFLIPSMIARLVLSTAVKVVVYPLISTIETVLYYDIRIRREGFDIEYLAAIAPQAPFPEQPAST